MNVKGVVDMYPAMIYSLVKVLPLQRRGGKIHAMKSSIRLRTPGYLSWSSKGGLEIMHCTLFIYSLRSDDDKLDLVVARDVNTEL